MYLSHVLPAMPAAVLAERSPGLDRATLLALDLGTTTGWATQLAGGSIESGTASFRPTRYDGGGMRYLGFRSWLDGIAGYASAIAAVYFEEVRRHIGTDAAHLYGGFLATLSAWCELHGIPYEGVPVGTIILDDACIALSLLLQHGVEPAALASSMGRLGDGRTPASIIGALADLLAREARA